MCGVIQLIGAILTFLTEPIALIEELTYVLCYKEEI